MHAHGNLLKYPVMQGARSFENFMTIGISTASIIKLILGGLFTYFIFPVILVARDMLLQKLIQKFIITDKLNSMMRMCEDDRWLINNRYNESTTFHLNPSGGDYKYFIGENETTYEEFKEYEKNQEFHTLRFESSDASIARKHNLIVWLTKHYKQAEGGNPIPRFRESYYQSAENSEALRKTVSNNSSKRDAVTGGPS